MKKKLKNKLLINVLKSKAIDLRSNSQIPMYLAKAILRINESTDTKVVEYLKECSIHLLRVKGYYSKFPQIEKECNTNIRKALADLDFVI